MKTRCIHSQHTNTNNRKLKYVKGNTSHTLHSLHSYARDMQRVPRSQTRTSESPLYPGSTPGLKLPLNPCNHLAWLACGPWRTHIQAWHEMVWYGMAWGLRPLPRRRRGHHRAGGAEAGVEAEAGAAKAGAAAWSSEVSEARAGARAVVVGPGDSFTTHQLDFTHESGWLRARPLEAPLARSPHM